MIGTRGRSFSVSEARIRRAFAGLEEARREVRALLDALAAAPSSSDAGAAVRSVAADLRLLLSRLPELPFVCDA